MLWKIMKYFYFIILILTHKKRMARRKIFKKRNDFGGSFVKYAIKKFLTLIFIIQ